MKTPLANHAGSSNKENTMKRLNLKNRRGQGMTEYIIIVALIAIAAIGVITTFGNDIRHIFDSSTDALSGNTAAVNSSQKYGTKANDTLKDFGQNNAGK
jgi:pilus assembly protein Flp/PilA